MPADQALACVLAGQQLLLVLDNCEHVIGAAAELCRGSWRRVMMYGCWRPAGSRWPWPGRPRYRLGPLALPDPDDPADVARADAVALFADRARRADARFALDDQAGPVVERLDGMPLAIELAAARVEALGVAQLLDRMWTTCQHRVDARR